MFIIIFNKFRHDKHSTKCEILDFHGGEADDDDDDDDMCFGAV